MRPISNEFSSAMLANSTLLVKATLRLADGTVRELVGDDIVDLSVEQATSSDGSFDIGACVIGKCDVTLNNHDRRFDDYDFTGSSVSPQVGKELPSGVTEWVPLGKFHADQPDAYGGTIAISCLDDMSLLERGIGGVTLAGTTMPAAVANICAKCGVPYDARSLSRMVDASAVVTATFEEDSSCLDVLGAICQRSGCFARFVNDKLTFGWYDTPAIEAESWINGGVLDGGRPYATGSDADGGSFSDYSSGSHADGGSFDNHGSVAHLFSCTSLTVSTDDVVITGIEVTAQDKPDTEGVGGAVAGETALSGSRGYVLSVSDNRLIAYGTAGEVASRLASGIVGMRFRPFAADANCDPSVEPGDAVVVTDDRGNTYASYVTSVALRVNGGMTVKCSAKSASRNSAVTSSAVTRAIVEARNAVRAERTERERAMADLKESRTGLYATDQRLEDGSVVHFMHDKPTIAASRVIWKMTAEAVAVSTDGGRTYATGISADGTAVLNRLYAIGINADYITAGTITVKNGQGQPVLMLGDGAETGLSVRNPFTGSGFLSLSKYAFAQPSFAILESVPQLSGRVAIGRDASGTYHDRSGLRSLLSGLGVHKTVHDVMHKDFETTDTGYVAIDVSARYKGDASGDVRSYASDHKPSGKHVAVYSNAYVFLTASITDKASGAVARTFSLNLAAGSVVSSGQHSNKNDIAEYPQSTRAFARLGGNKKYTVVLDARVVWDFSCPVEDSFMRFEKEFTASITASDLCIMVTPCGM